jgi:aryl-alcohol dehydrogenase-like predicted oxidoreductase
MKIVLMKVMGHSLRARASTGAPSTTFAWLLSKGDDIAAIPGTRRPQYLSENIHAASVKLTAEEIDELDAGRAVYGRRNGWGEQVVNK